MSTLQATNLKHGSSASNNLVLDSSGNVTAAGTVAMASPFAMRNKIINGAMEIDQRNSGASVTPTDGQYVLDRWKQLQSVASKYSVQQNAGAVTPPTGFTNYLGVTSLSAYSVGSSDYFAIIQEIEGFNSADLAWGTSSASTITVSFWVRSSLTGTFGASIGNGSNNRGYPFTYTISVANTWEKKSVVIPGDTTGTWGTGNGIGLRFKFSLGVGSTYNGTAGSWQAANLISATGATSVVGTNGATFYLTGVQLEVGSVATPFERRLYPQELAMCQRYYETSGGDYQLFSGYAENGTPYYNSVRFIVTKRTAPTTSITSVANNRFSGTPSASSIGVGGFYGTSTCNSTGTNAYFQYSWTAASEL